MNRFKTLSLLSALPPAAREQRSGRLYAGATVALICLALGGDARAKPADRCQRWAGWAKGNDSGIRLQLRICRTRRGVAGTMRWDSKRSGWNVRRVVGRFSHGGKRLRLRDTRITRQKPKPGWRFCLIDSYDLQRVGIGQLRGTYHSAACRDRAKLTLWKVKAARK